MNFIKTTLYFISLILSFSVNAQVLKSPDTTSSKKVEVFVDNHFDDGPVPMNMIKLNPVLIFNGEIPIYFERSLTKKLTAEAGVGPTFKDYVGIILRGADQELDGTVYQPKTGVTLKLGLRFYPGEDGFPDGAYFASELRHKYYKQIYIPEDVNSNQNDITLLSKFTDFVLVVGYQTEWESNFFIDYYAGVGLRNKYVESVDYDFDSSGNPVYYIDNLKGVVPMLSVGFKLGFGF